MQLLISKKCTRALNPPFRRSKHVSKKRGQITKFGQTNGRTYHSLYRVTEIKWLKDTLGTLASLIPETQNVCLESRKVHK